VEVNPNLAVKRESLIEVDGKFADVALGRFSLDSSLPRERKETMTEGAVAKA
jgi:hypothetical protein